ncbi:MAG: N-acetylneuraminate synthase family protein [Planctomycetes bacterium]|nr:N-acetylneuraminate synthase family protein [Planctomycetota bacterium]
MLEMVPRQTRTPSVEIAGRTVGTGCPVYVIAEIGVNHDGSIDRAKQLIRAAKDAGADAVKFQIFSAKTLVTPDAPVCTYQKEHDPGVSTQQQLLANLELPLNAVNELYAFAHDLGIDFLATPFGLRELGQLVELRIPAMKIASPDIINIPLLVAAAHSNIPIIASTGAATLEEIELGVRTIRRNRHQERLILLHCISSYPTQPADARLACIRQIADHFGVPVGFSDHTPDEDFSALAVAAGACVLEKHMTHSRSATGPDHFFSLEPAQFAQYVASARTASAALGHPRVAPSAAELEIRDLARRSIVTQRPVSAGSRIAETDLEVRRPAGGISPAEWPSVVGRIATADIPADTRVEWSMLAPDNQ